MIQVGANVGDVLPAYAGVGLPCFFGHLMWHGRWVVREGVVMGVDPEQVPRRRRKFAAEYRHEAARLVLTSGRTIADVAKELGLGEQLLGKWVRAQKETAAGDLLSDDERAELKRLRRENSQLRMDNEFLEKAAAFFASKRR